MQELCIGRIVIHSLLLLALCFSDDKHEVVIEMVLEKKHITKEEYNQTYIQTILYLGECILIDWGTLQKAWDINDEKIMQIIQGVIIGIINSSHKFTIDKLTTNVSRTNLENDFKTGLNELKTKQNHSKNSKEEVDLFVNETLC